MSTATHHAAGSTARRQGTTTEPSPHLLLVANAHASGVLQDAELPQRIRRLLAGLGARTELRLTESVEELEAVLQGEERITALLGGDGTVHTVANLRSAAPTLALLPAGGANNIARSLLVPSDLRAAARLAVEGRSRLVDLLQASTPARTYLVVEGISIGYLALARSRYHGANSSDHAAALTSALGALHGFRAIPVAVESDGELAALRVSQLFVANLPLYAFGLCVAPDADPTDRLMNVVAIQTRTRAGLLAILRRLHAGVPAPDPHIRRWQASSLRISTPASPVIADSENLGEHTVGSPPHHAAACRRRNDMTSALSLTGATALHRRWLIAFAAASAGAGLGRAVVTTYLPVLLERIQDAPGLIGTVALVNAAAGFAVPLLVGIAFDRRRRVGEPIGRLFLAAGAAITGGGLLAIGLGAGTSYLVLAIFAAIAYAGLNVITTTHRALVREDFDPEQRGRVTASQEFALLAGGVAGLALGGLLIDHAAWAPFAIAAAAVVLFATPTLRVVPDDRPVAGSASDLPPSRDRLQALRMSGVRAFLAAEVLWVLGYAALPTFFVLYAENVLGLQAAAAAAWLAGFGIATAAAVPRPAESRPRTSSRAAGRADRHDLRLCVGRSRPPSRLRGLHSC